jgi:hypothetical protein
LVKARRTLTDALRNFPRRGGSFWRVSGIAVRDGRHLHWICWDFRSGIGPATHADVATGLAGRRLSALALVVALVATTSGAAFAQGRHPACEAKQHECGQTAKISSCCCGDLGTPKDASTPAQTRADVSSGVATTPLPPPFEQPIAAPDAAVAIHASPHRLALLDLTTLFACLLI